ncbi:oligosaccharide flippase family protein [Chryseobacterium gwangjuense]|uniref:oligosaccharide flippase family protein n=1 Tax=Chryseobacterium gwangjuense TaxID=1069980 RepID=UPI001E33162E|nr:oligosaccharide flippase family protein [Chryseobacterium gwangjuense]MCE3076897.1 oligosaccharide flippase family protein [Chryseobacterium gwangjuense]
MSDQESSYRNIVKATSLFGGVQFFTIIITVLRSKFIAVLLGSAGIGMLGLFNTTISLIGGITNFGIGTSAVRDVSSAYSSNDEKRIALIIQVLKSWVWITGIFGGLVIIVGSNLLSNFTFGNNEYTWSFVLISIVLLFNQLTSGQLVVLQGMRQLNFLAKANLLGSIIGLVVAIPLYYFYGLNGIIPALVASSVLSFIVSWFYAKKVNVKPVSVSRSVIVSEGKSMLKMGFLISMSGFMLTACTYILQIFISKIGGVEHVGLFSAGFSLINTYVGLIFTAMATDYLPRLSAISNSNELCKTAINQQAEISILILGPIILIFLVFIKPVILILYSRSFFAIEDMVLWLAMGIFFKAASWAIAFLLLAKGDSKIYFWNEFFVNFYMLILNMVGYYYYGLVGVGISFLLSYFLYLLQLLILSKKKYGFYYEVAFFKIFALLFFNAAITFLIMKFVVNPYSYFIGSLLIVSSLLFSYKQLDKRINISGLLKKLKK